MVIAIYNYETYKKTRRDTKNCRKLVKAFKIYLLVLEQFESK